MLFYKTFLGSANRYSRGFHRTLHGHLEVRLRHNLGDQEAEGEEGDWRAHAQDLQNYQSPPRIHQVLIIIIQCEAGVVEMSWFDQLIDNLIDW